MRRDLSCKRYGKERGFTLIELLVVIAVIALLLSIMTPALNRARELSRITVCQSNFRQIGLGISMYANDNNDYLPLFCARGNWWSMPPNPNHPHLMWFDLLPPYEVSAAQGILECPSDTHKTKPSEAMIGPIPPGRPMPQGNYRAPYNDGPISYRYNVRFNRSDIMNDDSYRPYRIMDFRSPTRVLIIADGVSLRGMMEQGVTLSGGYDFSLEADWSYIGNRHRRGRGVYLFNGLLGDMSLNTWDQDTDLLSEFNWKP